MIHEDIDQLLQSLRMQGMRAVVEQELARAQKAKSSYADFYARVLREQFKLQRERSLEYRIHRAALPERWALETFPSTLSRVSTRPPCISSPSSASSPRRRISSL